MPSQSEQVVKFQEKVEAVEGTEAAAENQLYENEQWLRMLIDSAEDYAIFTISPDGRIATWNRGAEKVFGYRRAEILGQSFSLIFVPEDREKGAPEEEIRLAQEQGYSPDERWHLRKDGSRFFVSGAVRPLRDSHGVVHGFLKVAHDVTEQRRKEQALRESEERFRLLWENVKDFAIFTFDLNACVTHWNPGAEKLFGYRPDEILGQSIDALFTMEDQRSGLPRMERESALREGTIRHENWLVRKDGRKLYATEAVQQIKDNQGMVRGFAKIARDITERKKLEDELREARDHLEGLVSERTAQLQATLSELEAFSYSMSHDLRSPLRALRGYSEVLAGQFGEKLGPEGLSLVNRIIEGACRLDQLTQDVLTFGQLRREEIGLEVVDLEAMVGRTIQTHPEFQPPNAQVTLDASLRRVLGCEPLLSQVFSNFLQNAIKFVASGVKPQVRIWTEPRDTVVRIWVEDNGIGIERHQQERIFDMFQRLHRQDAYPGTGVGLAIVRKAAEKMGGKVGVESEVGKGSRFWLELARPSETGRQEDGEDT
jgi:PAS domain S-box-containing protein